MGLQSSVQHILKEGGNIEKFWSIERILNTADKPTGANVLRELYNEMAANPVEPDLKKLWHELGVLANDGKIKLNENAPLADIRRAIITPPG